MNLTTRTTAVAALVCALVATAAPAMAERIGVADPADATASLSDIRRATLAHGLERVFVKVRYADLRPAIRGGGTSVEIFLETNSFRRGPEFRLGAGLHQGTDYQLTRMRGWKSVGSPMTCQHAFALDYAKDVSKFEVARSCIGTPDAVRVAVKMTDRYDASHPVRDWLVGQREFTAKVESS